MDVGEYVLLCPAEVTGKEQLLKMCPALTCVTQ